MKELYTAFFIPNFTEIQAELLDAIDHDYKAHDTPHAFTYNQKYMEQHCPMFMAWLKPKLKLPVRIYRYYITPPNQDLNVHIDGVGPTVPFGLNIPIIGTENTFHTFYELEPDNIEVKTPDGYLGGMHPKDPSKLRKIIDLEITRPYITNNEIAHGVQNHSDKHRVMFTVRWAIHPTRFRNVEEVMDTSELNLEPGYIFTPTS